MQVLYRNISQLVTCRGGVRRGCSAQGQNLRPAKALSAARFSPGIYAHKIAL